MKKLSEILALLLFGPYAWTVWLFVALLIAIDMWFGLL